MSSTQRTGLLLLVFFAVIVGGAWQAADKPQPVQKWEYKQIFFTPGQEHSPFDKSANALGEKGWELVAVHAAYVYFKRPLQ